MPRYVIDISNDTNTFRGEFVRSACDKINKNFDQLYNPPSAGGQQELLGSETHIISQDLTLTTSSKGIQNITALEDELSVFLPSIETYADGGPLFYIRNKGSKTFFLRDENKKIIRKINPVKSVLLFKTNTDTWADSLHDDYRSYELLDENVVLKDEYDGRWGNIHLIKLNDTKALLTYGYSAFSGPYSANTVMANIIEVVDDKIIIHNRNRVFAGSDIRGLLTFKIAEDKVLALYSPGFLSQYLYSSVLSINYETNTLSNGAQHLITQDVLGLENGYSFYACPLKENKALVLYGERIGQLYANGVSYKFKTLSISGTNISNSNIGVFKLGTTFSYSLVPPPGEGDELFNFGYGGTLQKIDHDRVMLNWQVAPYDSFYEYRNSVIRITDSSFSVESETKPIVPEPFYFGDPFIYLNSSYSSNSNSGIVFLPLANNEPKTSIRRFRVASNSNVFYDTTSSNVFSGDFYYAGGASSDIDITTRISSNGGTLFLGPFGDYEESIPFDIFSLDVTEDTIKLNSDKITLPLLDEYQGFNSIQLVHLTKNRLLVVNDTWIDPDGVFELPVYLYSIVSNEE